jgi:hypothetical protein
VHVQLADSQPPEGPVNLTPSRLQHAPENQDVSSLNTPGNHAQDADKYNDVSPVSSSHPQPHTGIVSSPISSTESGTQHDLKDTRRREAAEEEERQRKAGEEPRRREVEENEERIPDKPKHVAYADDHLNYEIHEPKPIPFTSRLLEIPDESVILSLASELPYVASSGRSSPIASMGVGQDREEDGAHGSRQGTPDPTRA